MPSVVYRALCCASLLLSASASAGSISLSMGVPGLELAPGEPAFADVVAAPDIALHASFSVALEISGPSFELFRDPQVTTSPPESIYGPLAFRANPAHERCTSGASRIDCALLDGGLGLPALVTGPALSRIVFPHFVGCEGDSVPGCRLLSSVTGNDFMNVDLVVTAGPAFGNATASANVSFVGDFYVLVPEPGSGLLLAVALLALRPAASRSRASAPRPSPRRVA